MIGGKVILTYKRKRPPSVVAEKHDESFEGDKDRENLAADSERGKRLCSESSKRQSSLVSNKESSIIKEKCNTICDTRKLAVGCCEKASGGQLSMDLQREGNLNSIQDGSYSHFNALSAHEDKSIEKDLVFPCVDLNNGNDLCMISGKSSIEERYSHEGMVANASKDSISKGAELPVGDKSSGLCPGVENKLTSPLITFRRRTKPKKDSDVLQTPNTSHLRENCSLEFEGCKSAVFLSDCGVTPSKNCLIHAAENLQQNLDSDRSFNPCQENEADGDISCCSCACARSTTDTTRIVKKVDGNTGTESKDNPSVCQVVLPKDSGLDLLTVHSKIGVDFQEIPIGKEPPYVANTGLNSVRMTSEVLETKSTLVSLDISGPAPVDCNIALVPSLDEQPIRSSLNSYGGSHSRRTSPVSPRDKGLELQREKFADGQSLPRGQKLENGSSADVVGDKYNTCPNSSPALALKNNYLQLFPDDRFDDVTNSWQKATASVDSEVGTSSQSRFQNRNTAAKFAPFLGLSPPLQSIIDNHTFSSAISQWPNVCVQSRGFMQDVVPQYFPDQTSFLRHKMMVDKIVSRAKTLGGNRSSYLDKYDFPTTWSDEELDCLWIGVRRYGRGNWDAMLRDPRLCFSPWRTPRDLVEQWEAEQSKLFNSTSFSQARHSRRPNFLQEHFDSFWQAKTGKIMVDDVQLSLGDVYNQASDGFRKRTVSNIMMDAQSSAHRHSSASSLRVTHASKGIRRRARYENQSHAVRDVETSFGAHPSPFMAMEGKLPHWLKEVTKMPTELPDTAQRPLVIPSPALGVMHRVDLPYLDSQRIHNESRNGLSNNCNIPERAEASNGVQNDNLAPATTKGKTMNHVSNANKQELIVIDSDASSEETISDDHNVIT